LTNAHVVAYGLEVLVQPEHSSEKLAATVVASAPGIDLAVLKLEDESFFDDHPPLVRSESTPRIQDAVTVYGYPQGGSTLSITKGIVSRIDDANYWFDTKGLRVQIDAAINHGNSGGPVVVGDKMIGLAFMILSQADNIGYVIPYEEIDLFLKDIADGHYEGKPVLLDNTAQLVNGAIRARLGLDKKTTGVAVSGGGAVGSDETYPLQRGDVITRIGDRAIDNTGKVPIDGIGLIDFRYLVQRVARDNRAP
jgi:S1-C subfamily serine protease